MKLGQQVYWIDCTRDIPENPFEPSYCKLQSVFYTIRWGRLKSVFNGSAIVATGFWGAERVIDTGDLFDSQGAASAKMDTIGFRKEPLT